MPNQPQVPSWHPEFTPLTDSGIVPHPNLVNAINQAGRRAQLRQKACDFFQACFDGFAMQWGILPYGEFPPTDPGFGHFYEP